MMAMYRKPLIVLDDNLANYKERFGQHGFKVIFLKDPSYSSHFPEGISGINEDTKELESILSGRIFLTATPDLFTARQIELNFDMIVFPAEAEPEAIAKIISDEVQKRGLWKVQACWRLEIDQNYNVRFIKLEED